MTRMDYNPSPGLAAVDRNALFPPEYRGDYLRVLGDLNVLDLVNNPAASGKCCVFGASYSKQGLDVSLRQIGAILDDRPLLIR